MSKSVSMTNPFGEPVVQADALQILKKSFTMGIRNYDRGFEVWDDNRINEKTKEIDPGWVHKAEVTLECVIEFTVNSGKGTGRQCIPADEFPKYVEALRAIVDSDFEEPKGADRGAYIPTYDIVKESFKMTYPRQTVVNSAGKQETVEDRNSPRDIVSVRCTGGKGAKPMLVPRSEFPEIVTALESISAGLDGHVKAVWSKYKGSDSSQTPGSDD